MTAIFAAAFLIVAAIFAIVALFLTEKLKDLTNWTTKVGGYVLSFFSTGLLVVLSKALGVNAVFSMLKLIYPNVPVPPDIPPDVGWAYWGIIGILAWLVAGGIYDWRKT